MKTLQGSTATPSQTSTPSITPTYSSSGVIYDEYTAIHRGLDLFPYGSNPHLPIVRLITLFQLYVWLDEVDGALNTTDPIWEGQDPEAGVWLVGIRGEHLKVQDIIHPAGQTIDDPSPAEGTFYAFDANSGNLIAEGALKKGTDWTYESLSGLAAATATITTATALPTDAAETPFPTLTLDPTDIAGVAAMLTSQASTPDIPTPTP
jgi:hypothetical protein